MIATRLSSTVVSLTSRFAFLLLIFPVILSAQDDAPPTPVIVTIDSESDEEKGEAEDSSGEIVIKLAEDGGIHVGNQELTSKQLSKKLRRASKAFPDQQIILRGDEEVEFQRVVEVLDLCQKAGLWNVSFATAKSQQDEEDTE